MAIKRKKIEINNTENIKNINTSNKRSFSHFSEPNNTSFILQPISLEDLDKMVIDEFDKRFIINGKHITLINGMIESSNIKNVYPEIFNQEKEVLIKPIFVINRTNTSPNNNLNISKKPTTYVVPTMKPQGLVYEEYIVEPVQYYDLEYTFIFISNFKESINEMIGQMRDYFKRKRNTVSLNNERFTIYPTNGIDDMFSEEENSQVDSEKEYVLEFSLTLEGYIRKENSTQKRQKPNNFTLEMKVTHGDKGQYKETIFVENVNYPPTAEPMG